MVVFFVLIAIAGGVAALMTLPLLFRFRWASAGPAVWILKSLSCALSQLFLAAGLLCIVAGLMVDSAVMIIPGAYITLVYSVYLARLFATDMTNAFTKAFGPGWERHVPAVCRARFLKRSFGFMLPTAKDFKLLPNIPFAAVPGKERRLVCDLWLPPGKTASTGIVVLYLHGSAWTVLDKDVGTRLFFRHLASQGHAVMDVAYRLFPETDITGMVHDVRRAIAWIKTNASQYGVNPSRVVLAGGSAGGHLALLSAYLPNEPSLTPEELASQDLSVHAVISLYGPPDLGALYYHTGQHVTTRPGAATPQKPQATMPPWIKKIMGNDFHRLGLDKPSKDMGALASILGCHPDECPERYLFFSPLTHAKKTCPPTLIIQGDHDMFTPVDAALELHSRLKQSGGRSLIRVLPQTDHAFDLFLPKLSPAARLAFYDIERFLAVIA